MTESIFISAQNVRRYCDYGVWMEDNKGNRKFIEADNVILSTGLRNNLGYADDFTGISDTIISIGRF